MASKMRATAASVDRLSQPKRGGSTRRTKGPTAPSTGPAARGDAELIRSHVDALDPERRRLYVALLEATLPIARAKGGLDEESEARLRRLIG